MPVADQAWLLAPSPRRLFVEQHWQCTWMTQLRTDLTEELMSRRSVPLTCPGWAKVILQGPLSDISDALSKDDTVAVSLACTARQRCALSTYWWYCTPRPAMMSATGLQQTANSKEPKRDPSGMTTWVQWQLTDTELALLRWQEFATRSVAEFFWHATAVPVTVAVSNISQRQS